MTGVRYRPTDPAEYTPLETHTALGDGEYLAPSDDGNLDVLEVDDIIEILDWNYEMEGVNEETPVRFHGPPEPIVDDGTVSILYPADEHREVGCVQLGTFVCQPCDTEQTVPVRNGALKPPQVCDGCERQGPFQHKALDNYPDLAPSTLANPK